GFDADAEPDDLVRRPAGGLLAADQYPAAGIGASDLAGDGLEERALARPVRTDQATQFAFAQHEIDVIDREHAAKAHHQFLGLDDRLAHCLASCSAIRRRRVPRASRRWTCVCAKRRRQATKLGAKPRGIKSTTKIRIAPRTSELSTVV